MSSQRESGGRPMTHPWTVHVTIRCWRDREDTQPIAEAIEDALMPILADDEPFNIEVVERV